MAAPTDLGKGPVKAGAVFLKERSADPDAPSTNGVVIYAKDDGAGKTTLYARFATGAIQTLAAEP